MDLRDLFRALQKRKEILILIPLVAMIASAVISWFFIPPVYRATTTLMVGKNKASQDLPLDYAQILANKQLVKTYREIAQSRIVTEQIIKEAHLDLSPAELSRKISIDLVEDTELIQIKVEDLQPRQAFLIANTAAKVLVDKIASINQANNVKIVDPAVEPISPVKPNKKLNVVIAGIAGVLAAAGLIVLLEYLDNTIKTTEDISQYLQMPVLGVIPKIAKENKEEWADG